MSTTAPPDPGAGTGVTEAPTELVPPVVAVVVTRNPGPFLEETLAGLAAQDYPSLSVLVVDAGSTHDPSARVAAALPSAFVRRVGGRPGFGGAANEALGAVQGATFFLLCHDDLVLDPPAVRVMVEEAFRSNAAIIGPKIVSADNADVILEVGRSIDRLGGAHTGIEPGEVDQEQHDAVRDVFYVSGAAMLVRADLFDELGGFDPDTFPGSEDLDLCWRALLAGARVMVAPDARARHHEAAALRTPEDVPKRRDLARRRIRVVLTCSSTRTLLWLVPFGIAVSVLEAIAFALTRRRADAIAGLSAWSWNLRHPGRLRPARRAAQALRRVSDRDLRELQVNTGERIGAFLSQHQANRRVQSFGERSRDALDAFGEFARHPGAIALFVLLFFIAFGSRDLLTDGVPAVGSFARWPGIGDLVSELTSAWRHTGMGSTSAAPPLLGLMSVISTVLFGATGLAETLVVVGAFVVGAWGVFRLARALGTGLGGGSIAAIAYGISAAPRNAVASGRLGALMLYAFAPFIAVLVVRAGRFPGLAGKSIRPLLGLAIATALAAAWYPPAALVGVAIAVGLLLSAVVVGGGGSAIRALGASIVGVAGAAVLLVPWTATLLDVGNDRAAVGIAYHPHLGLSALLRMQSGPNGAGIAGWGLLAAALGSLLVTSGSRLTWATRAWGIAIVGYLAVDLPARLAPNAAVAVPEAGLAVAALGLALAAGLGASGLRERFATKRIGWPQLAGVLAIFGVALASFGFLGDVFDGGWHIPDSWEATLSFTSDQVGKGDFRILWVGDASVLPFDPVAVDQSLAWTTTRNGTGDARELLRAPTTTADDVIGRALQTARAGKTSRLGRMLAPMGIRYVAFAVRNGPDGRRGRSPSGVRASLAAQLDLARLGSSPGLVLYENESWAPAVAVARSGQVPVGTIDPLRSAVGTDLSSARRIGSHPSPAGTVLLAEKYDIGWHANAGGAHLVHGRAFGVTNSFVLNKRGVVTFEHDGKQARTGLVIGEAVLWLVALVWWSRGRRHMGKRTRARTPRDERERRPAFDALALTDDDFWDRA